MTEPLLDTRWQYSIAIYDESIGYPRFENFQQPFHPAIAVGAHYTLKSREHHNLLLGANLGYYRHRQLRQGIFLQFSFAYQYKIGRLGLSLQPGIGLVQAFATEPVYRFEDGDYREINDWGSTLFSPSLGFEISHPIGQKENAPQLFLHLLQTVESPFATVPIPHLFTGVGVKFNY